MMVEIVERMDKNHAIINDLVSLMNEDKDLYNRNRQKFDYVIKSCSEMVKENGETVYKCNIKFNDENAKQKTDK